MKQLTLAAVGFERYAKTTRRAAFLAEMERLRATKGAHDCSRRRYDGSWQLPGSSRRAFCGPERTPCSSKMKSVRFATYHLTEI